MTGMKHHLPPLRSLQDDYDRDAAMSAAQAADARPEFFEIAVDQPIEPGHSLKPAISFITPEGFPASGIAAVINSMVHQAVQLHAAGFTPTFLINGEVVDLDGLNTLHR